MNAKKEYATASCVANFMTVDKCHLAMFSTDAQAADCLVKLNAHEDLVHELNFAHKIIAAMLNAMTIAQKTKVHRELDADGISGEGMTRANERLAVLAKAGAV